MRSDRVKKTNYGYVLAYILAPAALGALGVWMGRAFLWGDSQWAGLCDLGPLLLAILWWAFGGRIIFYGGKKKLLRQLDGIGVDHRQIFYSDDCVVSMDMEQAKLALLFFWNPFTPYLVPAGRVTRAWTDDGARGTGILRGTGRVSFWFEVDGVKLRVNTFLSNQRWRLDDDRVLEGISKADMWVHVLEQARRQEAGV